MKTYSKKMKEFQITPKSSPFCSSKIRSSKDAFEVIKQFYSTDIEVYESFFILLLNRANNTVGYAKISQGGICGTVIDVKIIANYVVNSFASSVILAHNHPSGNLQPSNADKKITEKITAALQLFDCTVLDHLILAPENHYFSFGDKGLI